MTFPSICMFCRKRFESTTLSNCCSPCYRKYQKLEEKHGKDKAKKLMKKAA